MVQTVIYYGPWQCNATYMAQCESRCAREGHALLGCIWLADIKGDWTGRFLGLPAKAGTRYAVKHCCCSYPEVSSAEELRRFWDNARRTFRRDWAEEFGAWPQSGGRNWPGHHIHDLLHGGAPVARSNVLPVPEDVHKLLNDAYPACYSRDPRWLSIGPEKPYVD
ncbi:hypothetical protein VZQ01_21145 [Myxococcus faecalis]|uniref:hypothetical protein n=1 Tax=Myxococcus faecalis TaxID=3115646 RepID=UPI0024CA1E9D|nr:hypothetical protein MFMH1_81750 [Myxococcus sp. MH1]